MTKKIQNKMYILTGGLTPDETLEGFRFFTMAGLKQVPRGHCHRISDEALEVDLTGKNIEFDKYEHDPYWTCTSRLRLNDLKPTRVAFIDRKWQKLDIDPFNVDPYDYLKNQGYYNPLGYGGGWFSNGKYPTYKELAFEYFRPNGYAGINRVPEYDVRTDQYVGVWGDNRHNQIKIFNGVSSFDIQKWVGYIHVKDETVIIKFHDDEYRFHNEKDEDFIRWTRTCVESYNAEYLKYTKDSKHPDSNNREHLEMAMIREEAAQKKKPDLNEFLEGRIEQEIEHAQDTFRRELKPYLEK